MKTFIKKFLGFALVLVMAFSVALPAVKVSAATVKLNKKTASVEVGATVKLKLKNAKAGQVKWKSSNKKVATVSKGVVTGVKEGTAKITATYKDKKYTCKVTVTPVKLKYEDVNTGDIIIFGAYEQDNKSANGKEAIKWVVLDKNDEDQGLFLISEQALDCQKYHYRWAGTSWENCTLRGWLNDDFYNAAFSKKEQAIIRTTKVNANDPVPNPKNTIDYGNNTKDKVFLLSYNEAMTYFATDEERVCKSTAYAESINANLTKEDISEYCSWRLRTPGISGTSYASYITETGALSDHNVDATFIGIRPVVWISFDADLITKQ